MPVELPLHLPRYAFSTRDVARPGAIWRVFQEAAVLGSSANGWPPARFREARCAFVVRSMIVVHHVEARYGTPVVARTWVRNFRRGVLTTREIRLSDDRGPVAQCTQEWVHVRYSVEPDGSLQLRSARAKPDLLQAFPIEPGDDSAQLPSWRPDADQPERAWRCEPSHQSMDPLGHANHPAYLDWCDEHTSRVMYAAGLDPVLLVARAERVQWRGPIEAPGGATVKTRLVGRTETGDVVLDHQIFDDHDQVAATGITVRALHDVDNELLAAAFKGNPT
ncbi:MAG: acyl-CoA thioesterase FadM [Kiritimatiellia bacterium]|jgi:acyl-CoA thioesterase FadM